MSSQFDDQQYDNKATTMTTDNTRATEKTGLSRRKFLASGAAAATAAWLPLFRVTPGHADASCPMPGGFPDGIELFQQAFENWSGAIHVDGLWTCAPRNADDVLRIADWAAQEGYRLRARGSMHTWSPVHITGDTSCDEKIVMVSTTDYLTECALVAGNPMAVRTQPGVLMQDLLGFLEDNGLGFTSVPAPGEITIGGVVAIDGHGAAIPAHGENSYPGKTFGSVSNRVLEITVVQWDAQQGRHVLATYDRSHPHCKALITNLGRTFVTEMVLMAAPNDNLRCVSYMDIPAAELFAAPDSGGRDFTSYMNQTGRAEAIWFAFTEKPWLKVWSVERTKPLTSREVTEPYNYPFSDNIPDEMAEMAAEMVNSRPENAEVFGAMMYNVVTAGLLATNSYDIWGSAKNTQLYIKSTTIRATANGYAVLTSRDNLQRVLHAFYGKYLELIETYRARGEYPANMPVEIRCTGIDRGDEIADGAESPALSAVKPDPNHPERDVIVWFDVLSLTFTPGKDVFFAELEEWFVATFNGDYASMRPEWSKGWAYTSAGAWTNDAFITDILPTMYDSGSNNDGLQWAAKRFNQWDPHRIFSNRFLDKLLP